MKKKVIHKSLLKKKQPSKVLLNFKASPNEAKEFKRLAKKYTGGNVSALVKIAVKSFKPAKRDLVRVDSF